MRANAALLLLVPPRLDALGAAVATATDTVLAGLRGAQTAA
jgi:hypothetical protein